MALELREEKLMKHLLTMLFFLVPLLFTACGSDDSSSGTQTTNTQPTSESPGEGEEVDEAPQPSSTIKWKLEKPMTSPGSDPTPIIKVSGFATGTLVTLYSDSSCDTRVSSSKRVGNGGEVLITSYDLSDETNDVEITFYAGGKKSVRGHSFCSSTSFSYEFRYDLPAAISEVNVEAGSYFYDDPSGRTLKISTTFNKVVHVTGTPRLALTIGEESKYANYISGSGTPTLLFSYDVSSDDFDNDGIQTDSNIDLAGATIRDRTEQNAALDFTVPSDFNRVWVNFEEKIFSTSTAFAFLKKGGSVVTWGHSVRGGNLGAVSSDLQEGVVEIFSNKYSFAALKDDGSVITWGDNAHGGDLGPSSDRFQSGVVKIFSTRKAFAALKKDGSVYPWGSSGDGGINNGTPIESLAAGGFVDITSANAAFAARHSDGSVITWGIAGYGGNSSSVSGDLQSGVEKVFSTRGAFAALKSNGSVVAWGNGGEGGNLGNVSSDLQSGVEEIFSAGHAFAALKDDGSVVVWGNSAWGGTGPALSDFEGGVREIFSNRTAFAALKEDGSVVAWGNAGSGGSLGSASSDLQEEVVEIFSNRAAFAALKEDGSVVAWGNVSRGGSLGAASSDLQSGVVDIFSTIYGDSSAFAALKEDGSVVAWGHTGRGGSLGSVSSDLQEGVVEIFSTEYAFAALKEDGSVVTWGAGSYGGNSSGVDLNPRRW